MEGFNCLKDVEPLQGDSLPFTNKSPGVTGTHLIYLGRMKSQYILLYFYKPFRTLIFSRNFAQFSLKAVYVPMAEENLKFMVFRLSENVFATQKIQNRNFYSCPLAQLSPRFISSFPTQIYFPLPAERGAGRNYVDLHILVKCSPTRAYFRRRPFSIFFLYFETLKTLKLNSV